MNLCDMLCSQASAVEDAARRVLTMKFAAGQQITYYKSVPFFKVR